MIDAQEQDCVDIVTPPEIHADQCRKAAARGAHIISQRPLAPTAAGPRNCSPISPTRPSGMVHENWRWQPWYRVTHDVLAADASASRPRSAPACARVRAGATTPTPTPARTSPSAHTCCCTRSASTSPRRSACCPARSPRYARMHRSSPRVKGEDAAVVDFGFEDGPTAILDASRYNESTAADPLLTFGSASTGRQATCCSTPTAG